MSCIVKLAGKSHHGKNRIREHGELWTMKDAGFFRGRDSMLLTSPNGDMRWVARENDPDFVVLSIDRIGMLDTIETQALKGEKQCC